MSLPVNIHEVLQGRPVEWERLEFKRGWNPEAVLHTLCAFANDFHNLGGGYIFVGIADDNGRPELPPAGIPAEQLDSMQKEILELGYKIRPQYHPVIVPYVIEGRNVLVLWAPGGQSRPYKAPVSLAKKNREYGYYIRKGSATVQAGHQEEIELIGLAAQVPFDDRICHHAGLDDLQLSLIRDYLKEIGSELYDQADRLDFVQLCRRMQIVDGPDEVVKPRNVGLLFFNERPDSFFPQTQIDIVQFPEGPGGNLFKEKIFQGPLSRMLKEALAYLNAIIIEEIVVKHPDRAEADRFYNYPFEALEEALVNAVYHRSYEIREPIEVRILPDHVTITSYPGPDRSIKLSDLQSGAFISRRYRNRRIGEFLKELNLTEGRGTGIPKILRAMTANGSPPPRFETDDDRTYFVSYFPAHPLAVSKETAQVGLKLGPSRDQVQLLEFTFKERSIAELMELFKWQNRTKFRTKYIKPLIDVGWLTMTIPDKPRSSKQRYITTEAGKEALKTWTNF